MGSAPNLRPTSDGGSSSAAAAEAGPPTSSTHAMRSHGRMRPAPCTFRTLETRLRLRVSAVQSAARCAPSATAGVPGTAGNSVICPTARSVLLLRGEVSTLERVWLHGASRLAGHRRLRLRAVARVARHLARPAKPARGSPVLPGPEPDGLELRRRRLARLRTDRAGVAHARSRALTAEHA